MYIVQIIADTPKGLLNGIELKFEKKYEADNKYNEFLNKFVNYTGGHFSFAQEDGHVIIPEKIIAESIFKVTIRKEN